MARRLALVGQWEGLSMTVEQPGKRRPRPVPLPGDSLTKELDEFFETHLLQPAIFAIIMIIMVLLDWYRHFRPSDSAPWVMTVFAALTVGAVWWKWRRAKKKYDQLKAGRDGERSVGQYLEWFRADRNFVLHDIPASKGNIDHLIIGRKGIFTIETKTLTKPESGPCIVRFNAGTLEANGRPFDRNPIVQAKAEAGWLRGFLRDARFDAYIWPVVIIPGWFVEPFDMQSAGVWVLNEKALGTFITNQPDRYTEEQVKAIASAVKSYVLSKTTSK